MLRLMVNSDEPAPVTIESIVSDSSEFAVQPNACLIALSPGAICYVPIVFTPNDVGRRAGKLTIATNSDDTPEVSVAMSGLAKQGAIDIDPKVLDFYQWPQGLSSGEQTVTISNPNAVPMTPPSVGLTGASFSIAKNQCSAPLEAGGGSCTVSIVFSPGGTGAQTGTLTFTDSAARSPHTVKLRGVGIFRAVAAQASLAPTAIPAPTPAPH
jgi:hypothetical protein